MGPLNSYTGVRLSRLFAIATLTICATYAQQTPVGGRCLVTAVPSQVRSEGLTERMGDILLDCTGSNAGAVLAGNFSVALPIAITNRIDSTGRTTDAVLYVDYGSGFVPNGVSGFISGNMIAFNGISVTIPPSGNLKLKISNIRANVSSYGNSVPQQVLGQIVFSTPSSVPVN